MEKSNIVLILPKTKPWELQKYALTSFKFQDVDKNFIVLATEDQIKQTQNLKSKPSQQQMPPAKPINYFKIKILTLAFIAILSYVAVMWTIAQTNINLAILVPAFIIAIACSLILGKQLAQKQ
jgi:hypothetical protein